MPNSLYNQLLSQLTQHLNSLSFKSYDPSCAEADLSFHKRAVALTKFALLDTFITVRFMAEAELTVENVQAFSESSFAFALANKNWLPRGLFGCAAAFPLVVTPRVTEDVSRFINADYCPKHWASMEFPTIVELESGELHFFRATPMWGAAYYRGLRKQSESYFGSLQSVKRPSQVQ